LCLTTESKAFLEVFVNALILVRVVGCLQEPYSSKAFFITNLLHCVQRHSMAQDTS